MSKEDRITITIYHYNDTRIGHANYSITGTINGKTYEDEIVIGVNLDEGEKGTTLNGLANAFLGKGHIRDESHYPRTRDHAKTVIVFEEGQLTDAVKAEVLRQIKEHERIKFQEPDETNYDLFPQSGGTNCYEFLVAMLQGSGDTLAPENAQSPGLGVNLLDHIDGKSLTATAGGKQAFNLLLDKELEQSARNAEGARKQAYGHNRDVIADTLRRNIQAELQKNPDAVFKSENVQSMLNSLVTEEGAIDTKAMAETINNLSLTPSGNTERFNDRASSVRAGTAIYENIEKDNTPWWQGVDPPNLDKGENPALTDELKHLRGLDPDMSADDYANSETAKLIRQGVENGLDLLPDPENPESFKSAFDPGNYAANHDLSMTPEQWEAAQRSNAQQEAGSPNEVSEGQATRQGRAQEYGQELQQNAAQPEDAASLQYRNQGVEPKLNQTLDQAQIAALSSQHGITSQQGFNDDEPLSPYDTPFYDPTSRIQYYLKWEAEQKAQQEQARARYKRRRISLFQKTEAWADDPPAVAIDLPRHHVDPVETRETFYRYQPHTGLGYERPHERVQETRIQDTRVKQGELGSRPTANSSNPSVLPIRPLFHRSVL